MPEYVILVDEHDRETGLEEKLKAHELGLLHRAFSVLIFNSQGKLLLQQRAAHKYHSPLLWTNTCCSHPRKGESIPDAADRRLQEEMGMKAGLQKVFSFIYKADMENGLTEHEFDHVLIGFSDTDPQINPEEVHQFRWESLETIKKEIQQHPADFTTWFRLLIRDHEQKILAHENLQKRNI
ncbi:MAG: isopentenyl-diphosphate Delta-isomerase [Flavobacteriia bacterium]|nr:isopentenyl-diphosphate Delta-isomerase [Flavobacteriia bacterium]OJX36160.1 MAG: isopentenyl-diphosphate delta-isomerase [Flavobacteriia bacterium 40-80]